MYFKDKDSTNIDNEFNNDNILSCIMMFLLKYKLVFIIGLVVLIIILLFSFNGYKIGSDSLNYLILKGDEVVTIYQGSDYIEPGYKAYNSDDDDLSRDVKIESNVNINVVGEYEISYKIDNIVKTRKIIVVEKPKIYTFIRLNAVDNKTDIYLKVGDVYKEPGYQVFSSTGKDLNDKVKIISNVDTSKKGKYEIKYSLVDENGVIITVSRLVTVMDTDIYLSLNINGYTNKDVGINVSIDDEFFDYILLPNGSKIKQRSYVYMVSSNGKYTFKTYSTNGIVKEKSIEVNNINRSIPTGSCSGSFENGESLINIIASDDIGIKKYEIDGNSYNDSVISIKKELKNVKVKIYDNAGNIKEISCSLKDNNKIVLFGKDIKLNYSFFKDNELMQYALYSPNIDNKNKKVPLIVWLHGSGEVGSWESKFKNSELLKVLNEWELEGFNAYVFCPILTSGVWNRAGVKNKLFSLIDKIILEKNIDTKKIIIVGHSLGGIGAQYMAYHGQKYFSSMVILSGYNAGVNLNEIKNMPVKAYTENSGDSYTYTTGKIANVFGKENVTVFKTYHGGVPKLSFNEDKNGDGRSDLIEWMLTQEKQ